MAVATEGEGSLLNSPTWTIALTCFVFIVISLLFEKAIELAEHLIVKYRQTSLQAAFNRIKDELMLVGFISVALTVGQSSVAKLCIPNGAASVMQLCRPGGADAHRRSLAGATAPQECGQGHSPFIPTAGFHQLHIFIFSLAVVHIVYSLWIVALGMWTVSFWKAWEAKALLETHGSSNGRARLAKDTTFVRTRLPIPHQWMSKPIIPYVVAFFRQFRKPITETDYITLRHGFIQSHTPGHLEFDFHRYIRRSLQDDFQHVVGISPVLWLFTCVWLAINVQGWQTELWSSLIVLLLVLAVGTKMQYIIIEMAVQFNVANDVTMGMPKVKLRDELFWFHRPRFILWCIHFILFQNALDVAFVLWIRFTFSEYKCVIGNKYMLIIRLIIGIVTQLLCALQTLPSYALASQMGRSLKPSLFERHIQLALAKWHERAKEHIHHQSQGDAHPHDDLGLQQRVPHVEITNV